MIYEDWTQPIFSNYTASDGSIVSSSTESGQVSSYSWRAFDGLDPTGDSSQFAFYGSITGWWKVVFPYEIAITKLVHVNRDNNTYASIEGRYYADTNMTIPIGDAFTSSTSREEITIYDNETPIITNTIYLNKTGGGLYAGIGELKITAKKVVKPNNKFY